MHRAHHPRKHRTVADASVEYAKRRRAGMQAGQLQRHPLGDHPLLAAGMDEQQVFLAVLEKPEIAAWIALFRRHLEPARRRQRAGGRGDIGLDAIQRIDGDALALAQPMHQLAVVDGPAAKRRLRHVGLAAELRDLAENLVVLHRVGVWEAPVGRTGWPACPTTICPPWIPLGKAGGVIGTCRTCQYTRRQHDTSG